MITPAAGPTEIKVPVRMYRCPQSGSRVTLVGMMHPAQEAFYAEVEKIILGCEEEGARVYYEWIKDPEPGDLNAAPKWQRQGVETLALQRAALVRTAAAMGLVMQNEALKPPERWEVHDITRLRKAQEYGPTALKKLRKTVKAERLLGRVVSQREHHLTILRPNAGGLAMVTGAVGANVLLDRRTRELSALREGIAVAAFDRQLAQTPGADFVFVWGAAHLAAFGHALAERGYLLADETWHTAIDIAKIPSLASG